MASDEATNGIGRERLIQTLGDGDWARRCELILQHQGRTLLTKAQSGSLVAQVRDRIDKGLVLDASNILLLGCILDERVFIAKLQKDGVLRASRFSYDATLLVPVVSKVIACQIALPASAAGYLRSLNCLFQVAAAVRREYDSLYERLREEPEVTIKSCLAALDFLFMRQRQTQGLGAKQRPSRDATFFTVEELADGFSSLLAMYANEFGAVRCNATVDHVGSVDGLYMAMLNAAAHLAAFREWEFRIDRLGYVVEACGAGRFNLTPPSIEFERAVELGYIQTAFQRSATAQRYHQTDRRLISFEDFGKKIASVLASKHLIRIEETPARRYIYSTFQRRC